MHAQDFLVNLSLVLCVAALATVVFQRIHQPVVLGYILTGLIVGPYVPIPLVAEPAAVDALAELGVILLMFSIGLEFRFRKLAEVAPTGGVIALVEVSSMVCLGYAAGKMFGWSTTQSLFTGAIVAISSTSIVAKAFEEQGVSQQRKDIVYGVLIVEDLLAVLLMAGLTILGTGGDLTVTELALAGLRLGASLTALVVVGLLIVPRLFRVIVGLGKPETLTVAAVGLCFAVAQASHALGYSVALGAFLGGMLVAESGHGHEVELNVRPVRDVFAAVFFVAVGMMIDPMLVAEHWLPVLVLTLLVIVGKTLAVSTGAFLVGNGTRGSLAAGMSLAQIGEFSFIIASLGLTLGAVDRFLYPVAIAVSAITAFTTPALIRVADRVAERVDRSLPHPLQTLTALYAAWLEEIRAAPVLEGRRARVRHVLSIVAVDVLALLALAAGHAAFAGSLTTELVARTGIESLWVGRALGLSALALSTPLCVSLFRSGGVLGAILSEGLEHAGPRSRTPALRRTLITMIRTSVVLAVGAPLVALTLPLLPPPGGVVALLMVILALVIAIWREASQLETELHSGVELFFGSLVVDGDAPATPPRPSVANPHLVTLTAGDACVGQTLIALNLRGRTGATVLAITPAGPEATASVPSGREALQAGDTIALAGTQDAVAAAVALMRRRAADAPRS